ncbi:hypothetical protein AB4Z43_15695 [Mesorhizobium sp. 2RAF45]|uniref:hypothetical protein n=1 Tax=Mesorhizobium sp. 2RAF45 TaxID=3233001 RepID=UPI003F98C1A1
MAAIEIPAGFENEQRPSLIVALFNEKPIDAGQIGRLLADFQADYRRLYGRSLVVGRLETGSHWISLLDEAAWTIGTGVATALAIEGGKILFAYAKQIRTSFKHAETSLKALPTTPNDSFVEELRCAESLVKTAEDGEAAFQLIFDNAPDGSGRRMFLRYESKDTKRLSKGFKRDKSARRKHQKLVTRHSTAPAPMQALIGDDVSHTALIRDFSQTLDKVSITGSTDEIRTLIDLIANTLKSLTGGTQVLEQLAIAMELNGKMDISMMIRGHIPPRDCIPPIISG